MKRLILLLVFFALQINAQTIKITGKVIDDQTGEPLFLANVFLENTLIGTTTDRDGNFYFEIDPGKVKNKILVISYLGFNSLRVPVSEFKSGETKIFRLKRSLLKSQTVLVEGTIGKRGSSPVAFSKINRKEIDETYVNQDLPEFLSYLPSTTFYSEGGSGIGYNYLSIRGFDQRRISVSVNGIPQNDPEDHNVYWLDMPDLLESTELVQVQRGAGGGVIGYPAIGGSINIITSVFSYRPMFDLSATLGSYNTRKYSASFSSGLINKKYSVYVKLSKILSSGYRNLSWVNFNSYHVSAVRYDENLTTQINFYGGPISDGLTYTGLPKFTIKDKELRRENLSYWEADDNQYFYKVYRKPVEIENFSQPHFELLNDLKINDNITLNSALFLVIGKGFFDYDGSWSIYYDDFFRLRANGYDSTANPTNALIRAMVENTQWGWIPRLSVKHDNGNLILGGEFRKHESIHWGSINYAENIPKGVPADYKFYYYQGGKDIINFFVNENYNFNERLSLLSEVQIAYHKYKFFNEKYAGNEFTVDGLFVNPRIGFNYKFNPGFSSYVSFARVTREPRLKNYYDAGESNLGEVPQFKLNPDGTYNFDEPLVKPETMNDLEAGINISGTNYNLGLNTFFMHFNNEIVKKGQVDRFGQPVTGNMERTIHTGVEFTANYKYSPNLELILNGSYSKNYIRTGETFIKYKNQNGEKVVTALDLSGNRISGFPDLTFNAILKIRIKKFQTQIFAKYVGSFYSDNFDENLSEYLAKYPSFVSYSDNKVEPYFVFNLHAAYEVELNSFLKKLKIFFQVNNIFDNLYAAYAIGGEFFPAAERNFLAGIKLGL